MNDCKEFLFSRKNKCFWNATFYFTVCIGASVLILFAANDPDEFFRIIKLPINERVDFPLFLVIGAALLVVFGCYYIMKKCDKYKLLNELLEEDNPEYLTVDLDSPGGATRIDQEALYEIDEENSSSRYST